MEGKRILGEGQGQRGEREYGSEAGQGEKLLVGRAGTGKGTGTETGPGKGKGQGAGKGKGKQKRERDSYQKEHEKKGKGKGKGKVKRLMTIIKMKRVIRLMRSCRRNV